jgi:arylsulfatase A-like enzyme
MKASGYATGAFVGAFVLDRRFGLGKGFDHYYDDFDLQKHAGTSPSDVQRRGDHVVRAFESWLSNAGSAALFAWIHLYDPHDPYQPPPPFDKDYAEAPYDGEIAFVDLLIGRVFSILEEKAILRDALLVLVGDHGESLGEHSEDTHGYFIYNSSLHVPLIIRSPGKKQGTTVNSQVRSIDIAPTILDLVGLQKPDAIQGTSLVKLLDNPHLDLELTSYSETYYPRYHFGASELKSIQSTQFKYIKAPEPELYNLVEDPSEQNNLF